MGVEFWSTSFAAPEPSLLNLLVELVGNYPPMPLITQKTVRFYFFRAPRAVTPSLLRRCLPPPLPLLPPLLLPLLPPFLLPLPTAAAMSP